MKRLTSPNDGVLPKQYEQSYAVDWRFFLPISVQSKVLVIGDGAAEAVLFFKRIGLEIDACNYFDLVGHEENLPISLKYPNSIYDIIIIPDSSGFIAAQSVSIFQNASKLLKKKGVILIGFLNHFFFSRHKNDKHFTSTVYMMSKRLINFSSVNIFGCFPDLRIPEYIFPIDPTSVRFVLNHRYRYRFSKILLSLITAPLLMPILVHFFPAYYILAVSEN